MSHVVTGRWRLNSATSSPLSSVNDVLPGGQAGTPVTLGGQASIDSSNYYLGSGALSLNGTGGASDYASTQSVDTSRSFTIAAWVLAPAEPSQAATVFSLAGSGGDGLTVRYNPTASTSGAAWEADILSKDAGATASTHHYAHYYGFGQGGGGWDLVTVVYDSLAQRLTLYIDGNVQETDDASFHDDVIGFTAAGGLQLGRNLVGSSSGNEFWAGNLDDVWLFDGALTIDEIAKLNVAVNELDVGDMS